MRVVLALIVALCISIPCNAQSPAIKIPILMYHHIRDIQPSDDAMMIALCCPPKLFEQHLDALQKAGYATISFMQLKDYFEKQAPLPNNPIIISFDDGYDNNATAAHMLAARHMIGTFFIVVKTLNTPQHLTSKQLQIMAALGMEIGSHSLHHVDLRSIHKRKIPRELSLSRQTLQDITAQPVIAFCYPGGRSNRYIRQETIKAGYWFVRSTNPGITKICGPHNNLKTIRIDSKTTPDALLQEISRRK